MGKFNYLQNNFRAGEFSDRMIARTDTEDYKNACQKILNMIPFKQGGVGKRPGSQFIKDLSATFNGSGKSINIPFVFSKEEAYTIVMWPSSADPITATTENRTDSFADISDPDLFQSIPASSFITIVRNNGADAVVNGDLGNPRFNIESGRTDSAVITAGAYYYEPFFKSQFNINELDHRGFHFAQAADILVVTHNTGKIPPMIIARTGVDEFTVDWYHRFNLGSFFGIEQTKHYYTNVLRLPFKATNITDTTIEGELIETHRLDFDIPFGGGGVPLSSQGGDTNLYDVYRLTSNKGLFTPDKLGTTFKVEVLQGAEIKTIDFVVVDVNDGLLPGGGDTNSSPFTCLAITSRFHTSDHNPVPSYTDNVASTGPATFIPTDNWAEAAWSDSEGFPRSVCFFEQRLMFGATLGKVDTVFGSRTGNIFTMLESRFTQDVSGTDETNLNYFIPNNIPDKDKVILADAKIKLVTDPIQFNPSSQEVNVLSWLSSGQSLMVGSLGAEYVAGGGDSILSTSSVFFKRQTSRGGSPIMPVRMDNEVLYIRRDGRSVYNFKFNDTNGSFVSQDMTLHAEHIVEVNQNQEVVDDRQFNQTSHNNTRNLAMFVTTRNELVGIVYDPSQGVAAWHRYLFGGSSSISVHSASSIPSSSGGIDEIWVTLERTIDGVRKVYLEKIGPDFVADSLNPSNVTEVDVLNDITDDEDISVYLDSCVIKVTNTPITEIAVPHLVGETVMVVHNGYKILEVEVPPSGLVSLGSSLSGSFIVGLYYDAFVETVDLNAGGEFGTSLGLTQRIDRAQALLYKSFSVGIGHPDGKIDPIKNLPSDVFNGIKGVDFAFGPAEDGAKVRVQSLGPYPLNVLGIIARGATYDR